MLAFIPGTEFTGSRPQALGCGSGDVSLDLYKLCDQAIPYLLASVSLSANGDNNSFLLGFL